jgi:putative flippase GtrA
MTAVARDPSTATNPSSLPAAARSVARSVGGSLARRGIGREVLTFAAIGVASTAAYAVLYLALRSVAGPVAANGLALVVTAVGNTAANRRLTFGVRDGGSMLRDQIGGLLALAVALAITTASVNALGALAPQAPRLVELAVLVVSNAAATVARFVLLRTWITRDRGSRPDPVHAATQPQESSS